MSVSSLPPTDPRRPLLPNGRPVSLLNRSYSSNSSPLPPTSPPTSDSSIPSSPDPATNSFLARRRRRPLSTALIPEGGDDTLLDPRPLLSALGLFNLTISLAGMQFTWTVELAYGTPFLIQLGLSKSLISLVWLAGPLSGLIVQPLVGIYADRSTSSLGRRRPFILIGAILVLLSMQCISHATSIATFLSPILFNPDDLHYGRRRKECAIWIAVISFYVLDFAVNAVQASLRALVLDRASISQQGRANAWAASMIGLGSVLGYFTGFIDLPLLFPHLGSTQMEALCLIASFFFALTILWTSLTTKELSPALASSSTLRTTPRHPIMETLSLLRHLPPQLQRVCDAQFFAWMGWFPFLFYATSWVREVLLRDHEPDEPGFPDAATRSGSFALLCYSLLSLLASFTLPPLSHALSRLPRVGFIFSMRPWWSLSQAGFALAMLSSLWVRDVSGATWVIIACGVPWAIAMWAPFAIIGEECTRLGITNVGSILGVHNIYIVIPQFVSIAMSGAIFNHLAPAEGQDHVEPIGVVLRWGGAMAAIGALISLRCLHKYSPYSPIEVIPPPENDAQVA